MSETPTPEQDPVVSQSLSKWLLISSLILVLTFVWAMADEVWLMRPWKGYQTSFVNLYTAYLKKVQPVQSKSEDTIRKSAGYQQVAK